MPARAAIWPKVATWPVGTAATVCQIRSCAETTDSDTVQPRVGGPISTQKFYGIRVETEYFVPMISTPLGRVLTLVGARRMNQGGVTVEREALNVDSEAAAVAAFASTGPLVNFGRLE